MVYVIWSMFRLTAWIMMAFWSVIGLVITKMESLQHLGSVHLLYWKNMPKIVVLSNLVSVGYLAEYLAPVSVIS